MYSEVLAIGPYSSYLRVLLSRPETSYEAMNSESIILERLFHGSASRKPVSTLALATALNLAPWDHATRLVDADNVNLYKLRELVGQVEAHKFQELARLGFRFHFRPSRSGD